MHYVITDTTGSAIAYFPNTTLPAAMGEARTIAEDRGITVTIYTMKALWVIPPSGEARSLQQVSLPVIGGAA